VAEWTKAVDSKSTVGSAHRGFESHPLRLLLHMYDIKTQYPIAGCAGEVTEWPKVHDWKSCVGQPTEGSNPSLSAIPAFRGMK
jgi:hypothetical protein